MRRYFIYSALFLSLLVLSFACSTSFVKAGGRGTSPGGLYEVSVGDGSAVRMTNAEAEYWWEESRGDIRNLPSEFVAEIGIVGWSSVGTFDDPIIVLLSPSSGGVWVRQWLGGCIILPGQEFQSLYVCLWDAPAGDYEFTLETWAEGYPGETVSLTYTIHLAERAKGVPEFPFGTVLLTSLALCAYFLSRKKQW